jgi:dipeptidyl-peptidase-4
VEAFDPHTGARLRTVLTEAAEPWINLSDAWRPLAGGALLWSSERSGFRHLYLYEAGSCVAVTSGDWAVDALEAVDEANGLVYFTATLDGALERHLYVAQLRGAVGAPPRRLTHEAGMHTVVLDHACARFVDVHDSPTSAPRVTLRSAADGAELLSIWEPAPLRAARFGLAPPKLFTVPAADGTALHAALFTPDGAGPFPLVVSVYGGPHVQTVTRSWAMTVDMRAQLLRSRGFAVLKLDNRGSSRRGLAFEATLRLRMGSHELEDQAAGVAALVASGVADAKRVGIYGWSYGGYVSALAALRMPTVFRAAVAGAPVTSWDGYDTHYTERYMGLPQSEAAAYAAASALRDEPGLASSPLLIIHGMLDENVHVRHTTRLVAALTKRRAPHELLLFPDERHLPRGVEGRAYTERRVLDFLERELRG